jgi:hypothetical protein
MELQRCFEFLSSMTRLSLDIGDYTRYGFDKLVSTSFRQFLRSQSLNESFETVSNLANPRLNTFGCCFAPQPPNT